MLPIVLTLIVLGVSYVLFQSQPKTRGSDRSEFVPVRVRADRAPVIRRRLR
jgi:hypothetical protein